VTFVTIHFTDRKIRCNDNSTSIIDSSPVGKIGEKAVCRSIFLTTMHCILSAELTKTHSFRLSSTLFKFYD